jgi:Flp pilus assembly protein TadG
MTTRPLTGWLRDRRAVASSEFALILPVMLVLLFGTVEAGNAVLIQRKVTAAVQTAADLTAQSTELDDTDIANLFESMNAVIEPYPTANAEFMIQSVVRDGGGSAVVDWVEIQGGEGETSPGDPVDLPPGLLVGGGSVIVAEVTFSYTPVFGDLITGTFEVSDTAFLRPRRTTEVERL